MENKAVTRNCRAVISVTLALVFIMSVAVRAELIVYEGFEYRQSPLGNQNGGYGWADRCVSLEFIHFRSFEGRSDLGMGSCRIFSFSASSIRFETF